MNVRIFLQGDRGEPGPLGPLGPKGDGFPGPMVRTTQSHSVSTQICSFKPSIHLLRLVTYPSVAFFFCKTVKGTKLEFLVNTKTFVIISLVGLVMFQGLKLYLFFRSLFFIPTPSRAVSHH